MGYFAGLAHCARRFQRPASSDYGSRPLASACSARSLDLWATGKPKTPRWGRAPGRLTDGCGKIRLWSGDRNTPLSLRTTTLVEVRGVEPLTSAVRRQRSTTELHPRRDT